MKKLLIILTLLLTYNSVEAGCIPKYSVYEYKNQTVHMWFENINQTLIEWPIYNIENFNYILWYSWCSDVDITNSQKFHFWKLKWADYFYYWVNFFVLIIGIFFLPLFLISILIYKYIRSLFIKTFLFFILYFFWLLTFIFYFALFL